MPQKPLQKISSCPNKIILSKVIHLWLSYRISDFLKNMQICRYNSKEERITNRLETENSQMRIMFLPDLWFFLLLTSVTATLFSKNRTKRCFLAYLFPQNIPFSGGIKVKNNSFTNLFHSWLPFSLHGFTDKQPFQDFQPVCVALTSLPA